MRRYINKWRFAGLLIAIANLVIPPLAAEPVQLKFNQLIVNGNLTQVEDAPADQPLIMMVHGTLAHHNMEIIKTLRGLFEEQGYSTLSFSLSLALNNRTGMYDCSVPHTHKHTDALNEIDAWLSWAQQKGFSSVVLLGHSRGGNQVAWYASQQDRPNIHSIVLLAPSIDKGVSKQQSVKIAEANLSAAEKVANGEEDEWFEDIDFLHCKGTKVSAGALASYYIDNTNFNTLDLLSRIEKPVLVISGSSDTVVPDLAERIELMPEQTMPAHVEIEAADHFFRDLNADEVVEAVITFINDP